ncbi:MAG: alpha/beta fold hydrolase, partial [Candidatus Eremiobacteraeota bacterium]|nr:alpha/beta fold hydrolase [Candidatus Eremiobacteraeota bacterium]
MNADLQNNAKLVSGSTAAEPIYFKSGENMLFGWLHQPIAEYTASIALLICKPFGYEVMCSHTSLRALAEAAAELGVTTLRFDYCGTGDSSDIDPKANQLEVWTKDVLSAIAELQRRTGVERVCLFGLRMGALLAVLATRQSKSVSSLMLIAPVLNGRRYVRELRMTQLAAQLGKNPAVAATDTVSEAAPIADASEFSGYPLSAATLAALVQVDLTATVTPPVSQMLIIDADNHPASRSWAAALSEQQAQVRYLALPGLVGMLITAPQFAQIPHEMLGAMKDWLRTFLHAQGLRTFVGHQRNFGDETEFARNVLVLPGDDEAGPVTERPVFFSTDAQLFGIVTEPRAGEVRRRAVILLNPGADFHIGANRMHVSLARRWARRGYIVLRMDLAGLGDSGKRPGQPDNEVFSPAALTDVGAAIEFVRNHYGASDITLGGLCSGAYHSLRAAVAALPVNRILLINPENYFWQEGMTLSDLQLADVVRNPSVYLTRVRSTAAWLRLLSGNVNVWRVMKVYVNRLLLAVESVLRDLARHLRIRLPMDLGSELEELAARGVRVVFIFAQGEPGIDLLKLQAGASVKRLRDHCS